MYLDMSSKQKDQRPNVFCLVPENERFLWTTARLFSRWNGSHATLAFSVLADVIARIPVQHQPAVAAPPQARDCIQELDLNNVSHAVPDRRQAEKAATLARVWVHGVRRMFWVSCNADPAWVLDVLRRAAPTLEELHIKNPREQHLLAVHAMRGLRRVALRCHDGALDAQPPALPALPRGGLKWLRVVGLPRATLVSLLQAHSASLDVLWLHVGTPGGGRWPVGCDDLDALLGQCGLRVSRVVLWRGHFASHFESDCPAQVSAVRRVLPAATVQCEKCDEVKWEKF
ncbi:uncharacterized protein LOC117644241 [Thrips palmi]|uniref:Uncharacterized protein LOC117644241 n=1 Tax=Thrips palmi TaxID=161013 RepID=A0A6P8YR06_THRPL|nr:uncharacterized protein LOC117644241 [Thrips palmi]